MRRVFGSVSFYFISSLMGLLLFAGVACTSLRPAPAPTTILPRDSTQLVQTQPPPPKPPSPCEVAFASRDDSEQLRWLQTRLMANTFLPAHKAPTLRIQTSGTHEARLAHERSTSLPLLFDNRTQVLLLYLWRTNCLPCLEAWPSFAKQWQTYNNPKVKMIFLAEEGALDKWRKFLGTPQAPGMPPNAMQASTLGEPSCMLTPEIKRRPLLVAVQQDVLRTTETLDKDGTPLAISKEDFRFVIRQAWEMPLSDNEWQAAQRVLNHLTTVPKKPIRYPKNLTSSWIEQNLLHAPVGAIAGLKKRLRQPSTSWVHVVRITPRQPTAATQAETEALQKTVLAMGSKTEPVSYQEIQSTKTWAPFQDIPVTLVLDQTGIVRVIVAGALQLDPSVSLGNQASDTFRNRLYLEIERGISNLLYLSRKTFFSE